MWKKIISRILWIGVGAIPWEEIAAGVLDLIKRKVKEAGITLDDLQPKDLLEDVEVFLADKIGLRVDLDGDGTYDQTIVSCTSETVRTAEFRTPGTTTVGLRVGDGASPAVTRTVDVVAGAAAAEPFNITLLLVGSGLDLLTAFSAAVACVNNTGPGLGAVGPAGTYAVLNDFQTWVCAFGMLLGRLELFTLLMVFTPVFWRK